MWTPGHHLPDKLFVQGFRHEADKHEGDPPHDLTGNDRVDPSRLLSLGSKEYAPDKNSEEPEGGAPYCPGGSPSTPARGVPVHPATRAPTSGINIRSHRSLPQQMCRTNPNHTRTPKYEEPPVSFCPLASVKEGNALHLPQEITPTPQPLSHRPTGPICPIGPTNPIDPITTSFLSGIKVRLFSAMAGGSPPWAAGNPCWGRREAPWT